MCPIVFIKLTFVLLHFDFVIVLIQLGPIVSNVSGKVGGVVFSRNRGGAYAKTFTVPPATRTPARTAFKNLFGPLIFSFSVLKKKQKK